MNLDIRSRVQGDRKLGPAELQEYWSGLSERFLPMDAQGLAVICYAGMPSWFNGFLDRYQRLAFSRLTHGLNLNGTRVLDVGTGIGRWAHWFIGRGAAHVVGIDIERERLVVAGQRSRGTNIQFKRMAADNLAFPSDTFDHVNSVTVLQHVPHNVKIGAIAEISRVLRPNGFLTMFELTDMNDTAAHVFPESGASWEQMCQAQGLRVVRKVGDQYTPLIRAVKALFQRGEIARLKTQLSSGPMPTSVSLGLRALVLMSYPLEEICQRIAPTSMAKITGFLLQKTGISTSSEQDHA